MKGKSSSKNNFSLKTKLGLPVVFLLCTFFFLAGLYCSSLIIQNEFADGGRERARFLESTEEDREYNLLVTGETGDDSITSIPFQVLSWYPRALYFPNFATPEQCKSIISMAEPSLKPSTLALREGETEDTTKDVRTSSQDGSFMIFCWFTWSLQTVLACFLVLLKTKLGHWMLLRKRLLEQRCFPEPMERLSTFYAITLGRSITLIMMHFILLNMVHKRAKGYTSDANHRAFILSKFVLRIMPLYTFCES